MKYCTRCGTPVEENAKFCTNCGGSVNGAAQQSAAGNYGSVNLVGKLSGRLRISAILLLITAIMQVLGGLSGIGAGIAMLFLTPWVGTAINEYGSYIDQYSTYIGPYGYDIDYYYLGQVGTGVAIAAGIACVIAGAIMLAVCIVNFITAGRTFRYIKQIQRSPVGIVQHFHSAGKPVAVLVLNIISGGALGIIGAAFGLAARSYVTGNQQHFLNLER